MPRHPSIRQADITRAIKAAMDVGLTISSVKIGADGTIEVATAARAEDAGDSLDAWRAERDAERATDQRQVTGRVQHDPAINRLLADAEARGGVEHLLPAPGKRTVTAEHVAEALGLWAPPGGSQLRTWRRRFTAG